MSGVRFFVATFAVLAVATRGPAAPPDYYPLKVGTKWQYTGTVNDKEFRPTNEVKEVETIDGVELARVETTVNGRTVATEHLRATAEGVFRHRINGIKVAPPLCLVRYPVKENDTWKAAVAVGSEKATMTTTVAAGTVTVPAGKYKVVTADVEAATGGQTITVKYWFADGVGVVRQEMKTGELTLVIELTKLERPAAK